MPKKFTLRIGYESPFTVFPLFTTQKEYRIAWLINQQLDIDLKRIIDYPHNVSGSFTGKYPLYRYHYQQYRMQMFLLGNKGEEGPIISENPIPDFLVLLWNLSGIFELSRFQKDIKIIQQVQTLIPLNQKTASKYVDFFYSLEFFLTEQKII